MARGCPRVHCPLPGSQHRRRRGVARRLYPDQQQCLPEQPADECGAAGHGPDWVDLRRYRFGDDYRRDRSVRRCYLRHGPVPDDSDEHRLGWSLWLSAPVAILLGVGVGFFNGFITVKLRIPALITTLGTFFLLTGFTVSFAHSQPIRMPVQQPFNLVFGENRFGPLDPLFSWDGLTGFTPIFWTLAIVLILTLVLSRTVFGLHVISTGSNLLAAREIGVRTDRMKITAFMILGGLASLTGLITATVSGSAAPDAGGSNLTLLAIAAAVIGGTALTGGSGTVIGALIGAFVIACLNNGLVLLGAQATESNIYLGAAILAAMILNVQVDAVRVRRKR